MMLDYEFSFEELCASAEQLLTPLKGRDMVDIFCQMYSAVLEILPKAVCRGKKGELVGVSNPGERFIFYILRDEDGYVIKYRNEKVKPFLTEEKESFVSQAKETALLALNNPELFFIKKKEEGEKHREFDKKGPIHTGAQEEIVNSNDAKITDDRELYLIFDVNPEDYREIIINMPLFPMRAYHSLRRAGIDTVEQLLKQKESGLLQLKQFGRQSMKQVHDILIQIITGENEDNEDNELTEEGLDDSSLVEEMDCLSTKSTVEKCREYRENTANRILTFVGVVQSSDILTRQCDDFVFKLREAIFPLLNEIPSIKGRNKEIVSEWLTEKKTLAEIGEKYHISRERVRQIWFKQERMIVSKARYRPSEITLENIMRLSIVLTEQNPEAIFVYLKYLDANFHSLFLLVDSLFLSTLTFEDRQLFDNWLMNAPCSRSKPPQIKPEKIPYTPPIPIEKNCPRCGSQLFIYTARRGANPGKQFIGCSHFPRCKYSAEIVYLEQGTNKIIEYMGYSED